MWPDSLCLSDQTQQPEPTPPPEQPVTPGARHAWQIPAAALGVAALIGAAVYGVRNAPKPDLSAGLRVAAEQLDAHRFGEALGTLNQDVLPVVPSLSPDQRREFHLLRARALFLGQAEAGIDRPENHEAILSEYRVAQEMNADPTPRDVAFMAHCHLSLGDLSAASAACDLLPEGSADAKRELLKRMAQRAMESERPTTPTALDLLTRLSAMQGLSEPDRLWVLRGQCRVLVRLGFANEAIEKILKTLPRMESAGGPPLGEVLVTLAEAYLSVGDPRRAGTQLERALGLLPEGHELIPRALRLSGVVSARIGGIEMELARERLTAVVEGFPHSPERPEALLTLAEVESLAAESGESSFDAALARYTELVERVSPAGDLKSRTLTSLLARYASRFDNLDLGVALRFAELGQRLCGPSAATPEVLAALANTHLALAQDLLTRAGGKSALTLAEADPATQREAREHLVRAGEAFRAHAGRIVLHDVRSYGESLWAAADAFDRAGDLDASIAAFRQFQTDFPGDAREPEAAFRLAGAYRARGDLQLAAAIYRTLIAGRSTGGTGGPFADSSYVPLAGTLLSDNQTDNDTEAEGLLLAVARGEVGGVSTPMFSEAVLALAEHYHESGQYARAIERFEEHLARQGERAGVGERFRLAECYRRSAEEIDTALRSAMPDAQRVSLQTTRRERLDRALDLYEETIATLSARAHRSASDDLRLRNARFYVGDCAYGLGDFDTAIRAYDAARDAYPKDPASLVAMVQIVSALLAQGKDAEAATANTRARRFYESLPESVWNDPTLPMSRAQWESWLDAQTRLTSGPTE